MDRESVTTHLMIIRTWASFARERDLQFFTAKHLEDIAQWADDAIALLKELEAVKPKKADNPEECEETETIPTGDLFDLLHICVSCGDKVIQSNNYCPNCGKKIKKWE